MFEDVEKKQPPVQPQAQAGQPPPSPTPVIAKPPIDQSPFKVKSQEGGEGAPPAPATGPTMPSDGKGSSGKLKIILLIVLILVVLGAVGSGLYYFVFRTSDNGDATNQTQNTNQTNTSQDANTNEPLSTKDKLLKQFEYEPEYATSQFSDLDGDSLNAYGEAWYGTDKETADSDGDGFDDGAEVTSGYSPSEAGTRIDLSGIAGKCQNYVGASAQDKFPSAEYREDVCSLVTSYYDLQEGLSFITDGTGKDYQNFGQAVIDLCEEGGFLSDAMLENCVNLLVDEVTFSWAE